MTEFGEYPENIVVAPTRQDFYRVANKYGLVHDRTAWTRPRGGVYGVRARRIIVSATVAADPPADYDKWVSLCLLCRLAVDGEFITEGLSTVDAAEKKLREDIAERIRTEILPNGRIHPGYDCCGCSTYGAIADDCIDIVLGETDAVAEAT